MRPKLMRVRILIDKTIHRRRLQAFTTRNRQSIRFSDDIARANGVIVRSALRSEFMRARVFVDHTVHFGGFQGGDFGLVGGGNIEGIGVDGGGDLEELEAGFEVCFCGAVYVGVVVGLGG